MQYNFPINANFILHKIFLQISTIVHYNKYNYTINIKPVTIYNLLINITSTLFKSNINNKYNFVINFNKHNEHKFIINQTFYFTKHSL